MKFIITAEPNKVTKKLEFDKDHRFMQTAIKDEKGCWKISPTFREFITEENGCNVNLDELSVLDETVIMDDYEDECPNDIYYITKALDSLDKYSQFID